MFQTHDTNKHPLSKIYGEGIHLWTGIEIQIRRMWFMIDFQRNYPEDSGELPLTDTVLLSTTDDVLSLSSQKVSILSVYLMSPISASNGGGWKQDRVTAIWEATDPADPNITAKIFAQRDGNHHVDSLFGTTLDQLKDWKKLLEFPASPNDSMNDTNECH